MTGSNQEVRLDGGFRAICPNLTDSERQILEESLDAHGCTGKIAVWHGVLVEESDQSDGTMADDPAASEVGAAAPASD